MFHVKFFGSRVLRVIDDNFDALELKKSISKKTKNEIVLSRTEAMLNMVEIDLDRPAAARPGKQIVDRPGDWTSLQELARMRNT